MLLLPLLEMEAGDRPPCAERGVACTPEQHGFQPWRVAARCVGQTEWWDKGMLQ